MRISRTIVVFILLMLVGASLVPMLSIRLMPAQNFPSVDVWCNMTGASAEVVELELCSPLESALARLEGVSNIRSISGMGYCQIHVSLNKWTDPEVFRFEASMLFRQLYKSLPENASYPIIALNRVNGNNQGSALVAYTLYGPDLDSEVAIAAEQQLRPILAAVPGVDRIEIHGRRRERYAIEVDAQRLDGTGISFAAVQAAVLQGLGTAHFKNYGRTNDRHTLFMERSVGDVAELGVFPIGQHHGRIFRLADVAQITREEAPATSYFRINGQEQVSITVFPASGINSMALAKKVRARIADVARSLPEEFVLSLRYDNTDHISEELHKIYMRTALSLAILLGFVVLITRQIRYLLIVLGALLANVLLACIGYYLFGVDIHLYSLAGITLSLGLVVDNTVVVVEDLRHTGRNRIFAAILASTITAIGTLSVIFLLEEHQRLLLADFAIVVIINLLVSLPIAYFFIPALLKRFPIVMRHRKCLWKRRRRLVPAVRYHRLQIDFMLRRRVRFLLLFLVLFGLPLFLLPDRLQQRGLWAYVYNNTLGSKFYNETLRQPLNKYLGGALYLFVNNQGYGRYGYANSHERTHLRVSISMPKGATMMQMDKVVRKFEAYLTGFRREVDVFEASVQNANTAEISISFNREYEGSFPYRLKQLLEIWAIEEGSADFAIYGVGRGFSNAINMDKYDSMISLTGYNYQHLQALALGLRDSLLQLPRVQDVLIGTRGRYDSKPTSQHLLQLANAPYLSLHGISLADIGSMLNRVAETDAYVGQVQESRGALVDVSLLVNRDRPPALWSVLNSPMQVNDSVMLRLDNMGVIGTIRAGENIVRNNQEYVLNVHYRFVGTYELNNLVRKRLIDQYEKVLPTGYAIASTDYSGDWWNSDSNNYLWMIPLVLVIIYIICAVLLESLWQSIAVILIIPFSFIGVFLTFRFLGLAMDQGAYASLLMVSALVTNNALYVINDLNYFARKRAGPVTPRRYTQAFNAKALPIMLTTAAAVLSLLPFMLYGDEQGFWFTLSAGTIGGLLFSVLGVYLLLPLCLLPKKPLNPNHR